MDSRGSAAGKEGDRPGSSRDAVPRYDGFARVAALTLLATAIQVHFPDRGAKERSLIEFMAIRFQWPATRTRRRLDSLVDMGVLRCSRDLADHWTKAYEVLDRPHVPSVLAVEMGA